MASKAVVQLGDRQKHSTHQRLRPNTEYLPPENINEYCIKHTELLQLPSLHSYAGFNILIQTITSTEKLSHKTIFAGSQN